jgi:hypothetical protein
VKDCNKEEPSATDAPPPPDKPPPASVPGGITYYKPTMEDQSDALPDAMKLAIFFLGVIASCLYLAFLFGWGILATQ